MNLNAPTAQGESPKNLAIGAGVMAGQRISGSVPKYPPEAKGKGKFVNGAVVLEAKISKEGPLKI